jgi:hypothetical protein
LDASLEFPTWFRYLLTLKKLSITKGVPVEVDTNG